MSLKNAVIEQPPVRDGELYDGRRYHAGSERSKDRLRQLRYDPIGELVTEHHRLSAAIKREEDLRDGVTVELNPNTGRVIIWKPELYIKLTEQKIKIAEQLLRYGYGRVPETNVLETASIPPLIINTRKKGEVYHTDGNTVDEESRSLD
jgi:hypothetical protein